LCWGLAEAPPEVAVQVALVDEAGQAGDVGGAFAAFEEPAGKVDPQRHLVCTRGDTDCSFELAGELVFGVTGHGRQLIE